MKAVLGVFLILFVIGCEWKNPNTEDAKIVAEEKSEQSLLNYLTEPTSAILYSLNPNETDKGTSGFHGWKVLGQIKLDPDDAPKASQEFKDAVDAWKDTMPDVGCFTPRVGITVTKGGKTADFVLSFECNKMRGYQGAKEISYNVAGSPLTLNEFLLAAKLPISQKK